MDQFPRYNNAALAKNRWGNILCPQLPLISALECRKLADHVVK